MKEYWPVAKARHRDGCFDCMQPLFTYNGLSTKEKALDTIRDWADHYNYHLICAEIEVRENGQSEPVERIRVF